MTQPAARHTDTVTAIDTHVVNTPESGPKPLPHPFSGPLAEQLSADVLIGTQPAATIGSVAHNLPPHVPTPPGTSFQLPPSNRGTVHTGSATVLINGKGAARQGDTVMTCNDPTDLPVGTITTGEPTVVIG